MLTEGAAGKWTYLLTYLLTYLNQQAGRAIYKSTQDADLSLYFKKTVV